MAALAALAHTTIQETSGSPTTVPCPPAPTPPATPWSSLTAPLTQPLTTQTLAQAPATSPSPPPQVQQRCNAGGNVVWRRAVTRVFLLSRGSRERGYGGVPTTRGSGSGSGTSTRLSKSLAPSAWLICSRTSRRRSWVSSMWPSKSSWTWSTWFERGTWTPRCPAWGGGRRRGVTSKIRVHTSSVMRLGDPLLSKFLETGLKGSITVRFS